jgi:hypothetical protein
MAVYVVPDAAMPKYGEEVPRQTWEENVGETLAQLAARRAANPVYAPFKPGTQTLQAKQLAEQVRQHEEEMKYRYAALAQQAALARLKAATGGGSSLPQWQYNLLFQEVTKPFYQAAGGYLRPVDYLADIQKYSGELIDILGPGEYQKLVTRAQDLVKGWAPAGIMPSTVEWIEIPADKAELRKLEAMYPGRVGQPVTKKPWLGKEIYSVPVYKPWGSSWQRGAESPLVKILQESHEYQIPLEVRRTTVPLEHLGVMLQPPETPKNKKKTPAAYRPMGLERFSF